MTLEELEEEAKSDHPNYMAVAILNPYRQLVVTYYDMISSQYDYHMVEGSPNGGRVKRTQIGRVNALESLGVEVN